MSSRNNNFVYKSGVHAIEQATVTTTANIGDTTVQVQGKYMVPAPFLANTAYTIYDSTWGTGANGLPNMERFQCVSILSSSAPGNSDGVGYDYTGVLTILGDTTAGWSGGLKGSYTTARGAKILTPGKEVCPQSSDFNNRFKTLSDAPKIDMDDEASRFASGDEGRDLSIAGARSAEVTFSKKLGWAGDGTTTPAWDKLLRTMGHWPRNTATGIEYLPHTWSNEVTATIWVQNPENGGSPVATVYRYVGCHGGNGSNITASKVGDPYMLTAKYNGAYVGTTELSVSQTRALTSPDTTIPETLENNTATFPARSGGSNTTRELEISKFTLDFGGVVTPFIDQSSTTGYAYYVTTDRDPKLTTDPYFIRKTDDDIDYVVTNEVTGKLTIASAPTAPHLTIEVPNAQLMSPSLGSREGGSSTDRIYRCLRNNLGSGSVETAMPDQAMYSILIGTR